jgi:iron complex outermembrane receptor protein
VLTGVWPATGRAEPASGLPADQAVSGGLADGPAKAAGSDPEGILNLDIDQLSKVDVVAPSLNMEVSTVERQESTVGKTPAAVFVITNEMIRRSGVRTIPDALRLAPGVQVAQKTANEWAVTIRGFNDVYADKLLVQIDGRQVYTPLFGGVYWDVQDLVLEDVERIEVIRGPGATIWGANAVNGVINIITKGSKQTQGGYFEGRAGSEERGSTVARYGGQLGENATYRLYGKWFDRDQSHLEGEEAWDDWRQARTGFRIDWTPQKSDAFTLQGDYYDGYSGKAGMIASASPQPSGDFVQRYVEDQHVSGGNVLGRWTHVVDDDSDWSLQWYYDRAERHDQALPTLLDYDILDFDFQYRFPLADRHSIICGLGYRNYNDYLLTAYNMGFLPPKKSDDLFSYFVQDQIELREDLFYLILGSKFEHNDYTGFELQPTARVLWTPDEKRCLWAAISRGVQTPTRLTHDGLGRKRSGWYSGFPVFNVYNGSSSLDAADVIAYEAGMRAQPTKRFNWDLAAFFNNYQHLLGFVRGNAHLGQTPDDYQAAFQDYEAVSNITGETYGFELAAGYGFMREQLHEPSTVAGFYEEESYFRNEFNLWLAGDLGEHWFTDFVWRYVDNADGVPNYFVMDVRLAYLPRPNLEYALVGRNLLEGPHYEVAGRDLLGVGVTEVQPEVFGTVTYRF